MLKVFIGLKLRQVSKGNFHRKVPKWFKNRVKVSKIDQIRPPLHPPYCGNPPILSSELLWESTNSFIRPAVGIHFLAISASDLLWESTKSVIGAAVGIHQIWHRSCCGNPLFGNFSIRPTVGIHQICHQSCCGNPPIPSSELLWESMRVYNSIRWMYLSLIHI